MLAFIFKAIKTFFVEIVKYVVEEISLMCLFHKNNAIC